MLRCCSCQRGDSLPRHVSPCYAIFSPYWGYEQFPFFTNSSNFWEQRMMEGYILPSSLPFISLLTQQSTRGPAFALAAYHHLPSSPAPPPPPSGSCGGRPVSARTIGKQRPKIYLPVSSPSPMSKHSNRSWKNAVARNFCPR